ncbi:uncharacterized protein LY79DRAFT_582065 [Colletotrichum navitas]|uniref:Uncharacterized protein n=1 Tax=Colletotrichum navitas TaxID=681940 RepID=A0AAD8V2Y2_9PEZI|nr:uncharacterized protein LY79DRAFT_582065 [Colletotrichum navitas]KAK1580163.1 hypothetical protein LY79DRAFT_582065 [Colletotrichum navitas]
MGRHRQKGLLMLALIARVAVNTTYMAYHSLTRHLEVVSMKSSVESGQEWTHGQEQLYTGSGTKSLACRSGYVTQAKPKSLGFVEQGSWTPQGANYTDASVEAKVS